MILSLHDVGIERAASRVAEVVDDGGVAVIPTDTVYGMIADAGNAAAVERIYTLKERDRGKPFLVLVPDESAVATFSDMAIPPEVCAHVPGPLTFIMPLKEGVTLAYTKETIALRIPRDRFLETLLARTFPVVAPSANPSGTPPITEGDAVARLYAGKVDIVVDAGHLPDRTPSTLYDCVTHRVLRQGAVTIP